MKRLLVAVALFPLTAQIRVTTRLVEVNVAVRDKKGPVRGLAKEDFEILDRGKRRPIAFFFENAVQRAGGAAPEPLPPDVFSNRPERRGIDPASATVILFDAVNTPIKDQLRAKKQFLAFLTQIQPQDRVAVYSLGTSLRILSDFTNDPKRLAATVASYRGRLDGSPDTPPLDRIETGDEKTDAVWNNFLQEAEIAAQDRRVQITQEAVEAIARHIGDIPGRKNVIWVSAAFPFETYGDFPKTYSREITRMGRALSANNVALHPVDARGLIGRTEFSADSARPPGVAALASQTPVGHPVMDMLAQATGGRVFKNNNDIRGAIRNVLDDSEATYTLAFYPEDADLDSTFHKLKVAVKRPGVEVHHRGGYDAVPSQPEDNKKLAADFRGAFQSPLEAAGVRLQVELSRPDKLRFAIVVEPRDLELTEKNGRWTGLIDAAIAQRAADGRILNTAFYTLRPDLDGAQRVDSQRKGIGFAKEVAPAAGAVEARVVVVDRATGRVGSVIVPLGRSRRMSGFPLKVARLSIPV